MDWPQKKTKTAESRKKKHLRSFPTTCRQLSPGVGKKGKKKKSGPPLLCEEEKEPKLKPHARRDLQSFFTVVGVMQKRLLKNQSNPLKHTGYYSRREDKR